MSFRPSYPKKTDAATPAPAAAVNAQAATGSAPAAGTGQKPTHVLKFVEKKADGSKEYKTICNLFGEKTKAGEDYLKGYDKEAGLGYVIMPRTERPQA